MNDTIDDDVVFTPDEENSGGNSLSGEAKLDKQKDKIDKLISERDEYLLNWQKERADFVNYKKEEDSRLARARAIGMERGSMGVIKMLDTFDMAFANKDAWNSVDANWRMGVEYIYGQGIQFLQDAGIDAIDPQPGDSVDPMLHEAIETEDTDDFTLDGKISHAIQKGYKTKDGTLRPAKVVVYKKQ